MRRDEIHRGRKRWPWKDEGSGEVALVGLMPRKTGGGWGQSCVLVAPVLGLSQSWPLPGFQELLRSQWREFGREVGKLDRLAHTRQMFAQKNTVKLSCKYNRESASHAAGFPACLSPFCQLGVRRGRGPGLGVGGGLPAQPRQPDPSAPQNSLSFANVTPRVSPGLSPPPS